MEEFLGNGIYTVPDAARIIRATDIRSAQTTAMRRWAVGYNYRYRGEILSAAPLLHHKAYEVEGQYYINFLQLVESRVIGSFRDLGLSMQTIRIYISILAEQYQIDNPLALRRLWTDGKQMYTDLVPTRLKDAQMTEKQVIHEIVSGQCAFDIIHDFFMENIDYSDEGAERLWPLGRDKGIVIDPQRGLGRPIDTDSGISTFVLYSIRQSGTTEEDIAKWYGIKTAAVNAAVELEMRMAA